MEKINATPETLNSIMEFDVVIQSHGDGTVTKRFDVQEPDLDAENDTVSGEWSLMRGYSGQDRYSGPIMHNSEFIGGGMARDILERPGLYVALVANYPGTCPDCGEEHDREQCIKDAALCSCCEAMERETFSEGWAVAYIEEV